MRLLVSFCNLPHTSSSPRLLVDPDLAMSFLIDVGAQGTASGAVGLFCNSDFIYCAWIGVEGDSYLCMADTQTLTPLHVGKLDRVRDVHSITVLDDWLLRCVYRRGRSETSRRAAAVRNVRGCVAGNRRRLRYASHQCDRAGSRRILCSAFGPRAGNAGAPRSMDMLWILDPVRFSGQGIRASS